MYCFINEMPERLDQVIDLGDRNSQTLGFLPRSAIIEASRKNHIIICVIDDVLAGYLLWATNIRLQSVYIVHLCVDNNFRRRGIAHGLFYELVKATKQLFRGVRVHCRYDYEATQVWPRLGFTYVTEKAGRSRKGSTLLVWWYDFGKRDLFSELFPIDSGRIMAAIDSNVFFDLYDNYIANNFANHPLLSDWLTDFVDYYIAPELANEIARNSDGERRRLLLRFSDNVLFSRLKLIGSNSLIKELSETLSNIRTSDISDLNHIASAIISNSDYFITEDKKLIGAHDSILDRYNIRIVNSSEFIGLIDQSIRPHEYNPNKLASPSVSTHHASALNLNEYYSIFRKSSKEKKHAFTKTLSRYLSNPNNYKTIVISINGRDSIILSYNIADIVLHISYIRIAKDNYTILSYLLLQYITYILGINRVIKIEISKIPHDLIPLLISVGYIILDKHLVKSCVPTILDNQNNTVAIHNDDFNKYRDVMVPEGDVVITYELLKRLWPYYPLNCDIKAYIIPIKPQWAKNLIDIYSSSSDLFGGEYSLLLNYENIYYRSARPQIIDGPGVIFWYVTSGRSSTNREKGIVAASFLDDFSIDFPKVLFKRYKHLGIYEWSNIFELAKHDINNKIMAFRFSSTIASRDIIPYNRIQDILLSTGMKKNTFQAPFKLSYDTFRVIFNEFKKVIGDE